MAAERLTDDVLVEILSRVPPKSLCRFKCASKQWLSLIDHPEHRKRLPQTLAGFFYTSTYRRRVLKSPLQFISVSGRRCPRIGTSLSFLPNHRRLDLLDCCNGLLLCRWYDLSAQDDEFRYVVCNPMRKEWVTLPEHNKTGKVGALSLGFDPAVSSHFYVFLLLDDIHFSFHLTRVDVYSSETGRWVSKEKRWNEIMGFHGRRHTVFLNGHLYFYAYGSASSFCLVAVDTKGETWTWTTLRIPGDLYYDGFLQQSQGRLHYSDFQRDENGAVVRLVVYVLEDYDNKGWMLKDSVEISQISTRTHCIDQHWIMIHPECDLIFFTAGWSAKFMCYNMDHRQVKVISNLEYGDPPYLPYVPFYAELQSLHT